MLGLVLRTTTIASANENVISMLADDNRVPADVSMLSHHEDDDDDDKDMATNSFPRNSTIREHVCNWQGSVAI